MVELGLDSFGDVTVGPDGKPQAMDVVLRNVVEQAVLADELGIHFIGLGEHHRDDFAISSPEIILGAIASRTSKIKLGTAVTVLSTDDPVRVFQRFSTLNALSNGRAEPILGRGSFTESYPLFGFDTRDYDALFEERLDIFARLLKDPKISWKGKTRAPLNGAKVYPPLYQPMTTWVGVGGSPESVIRVARNDLQLMLAIIGGDPLRFKPFVELYHSAVEQLGTPARPIGIHSPGYVGKTDEEAIEAFWPHYRDGFGRIGRERGWAPMQKDRYLEEVRSGALAVGSPETVAKRIARAMKGLGVQRFDLKYANGPMPHDMLMETIRLYGEQVIPRVRELMGE